MTVTREQIQGALDAINDPITTVNLGHAAGLFPLNTIRTVLQSALSATDTNVATKTPDTAALDALASLNWHYINRTQNTDVFDRLNKTIRAALTRQSVGWMPIDLWHEDIGFAFWTRFPVVEPYYAGSPLCDDWHDDYYTHFIPMSVLPPAPPITIEGTEHDR